MPYMPDGTHYTGLPWAEMNARMQDALTELVDKTRDFIAAMKAEDESAMANGIANAAAAVEPMSYADVLKQPPAIWHQVEEWLRGYWPSRVRSVMRTMAGDPLTTGWLQAVMIEPLEALDAPVRRLFVLASVAAREPVYR